MDVADRFWSKVEKTPGCWFWKGARQWQGYGLFQFDGKLQMAHRVAWILAHGPIPEGFNVLHHCDTPPCVNHETCLFLGTQRENMQDKIAKGRGGSLAPKNPARGDRNGAYTHPERRPRGDKHGMWGSTKTRGEASPTARLKEEQVLTIRARLANGESLATVGRDYGVTKQAIWLIRERKNWKHL